MAIAALALAGCGTSASHRAAATAATPHPQAIEPTPGNAAAAYATTQVDQSQASGTPPPPGPNTPATVTKAPAKGAPTDAQVRAAIAQFQLVVAEYRLYNLNFSSVLLDPLKLPPGVWNVSIASVETAFGHAVACGGILRVAELGVANKTLPCGTEVLFRYGDRAIRVPVIDRGPYVRGRVWDLSGATAEALHFPGLGPIEWRLG